MKIHTQEQSNTGHVPERVNGVHKAVLIDITTTKKIKVL